MSKLTLQDLMVPATFKRELAKLKAANTRRWRAVPHVSRRCLGGPFDGQELALCVGTYDDGYWTVTGASTLPFSVPRASIEGGVEWRGRYVDWVWKEEK